MNQDIIFCSAKKPPTPTKLKPAAAVYKGGTYRPPPWGKINTSFMELQQPRTTHFTNRKKSAGVVDAFSPRNVIVNNNNNNNPDVDLEQELQRMHYTLHEPNPNA